MRITKTADSWYSTATCCHCGDEFNTHKGSVYSRSGATLVCYCKKKECRAEMRRWARIKRDYGLDKDAYLALNDKQGGRCAICHTEFSDGYGHVDHCHTTGRVRGLLCVRCNRAIGLFRDDFILLNRALLYIHE